MIYNFFNTLLSTKPSTRLSRILSRTLSRVLSRGLSRELGRGFDALLAPPFCVGCRDFQKSYAGLCISCIKKITPIAVYNLSVNTYYSIPIYAASDYQEPLKSLIKAKHSSHYYANKYLAEIIWRYSALSSLDFDYLVPIPLHWTRYAQRGFNQSHAIAQQLSLLSGKPVIDLIQRVKKTSFQSSLSGKQRHDNVKKAFELIKSHQDYYNQDYYNKKFIIVDDLLTTGATLKSVAQELARLKPVMLAGVVACRVL